MRFFAVLSLLLLGGCSYTGHGFLGQQRVLADGTYVFKVLEPHYNLGGEVLSNSLYWCRRPDVQITPSMSEGDYVQFDKGKCGSIAKLDRGN